MRRAWILGAAMAALLGNAPLVGQEQGPVLVRDMATGPAYSSGSSASAPVRFRGEDYFGASDDVLGDRTLFFAAPPTGRLRALEAAARGARTVRRVPAGATG